MRVRPRRRRAIAALACLSALTVATAILAVRRPPARASEAEAALGTAIRFDATTLDLGEVGSLSPATEHEFAFRNEGASPLRIARVRSDCGCASVAFGQAPVAPGDAGRVRVRFNPRGRKGSFEQKVYVLLAGGEAPCAVLTLRGTVLDPVEIEPATLRFGRADVHRRPQATATIRNRTGRAVRLLGAKAHGVALEVVSPRGTIPPGGSAVVSALVTPATPPGRLSGFLELTTDIEGASTLRIPVSGWLDDGPVVPSERSVALGFLRHGAKVERTVLLRHGEDLSFRVAETGVDGSLFKTTASEGWRKVHRLVVSNSDVPAGPASNGLVRGKATVRVDWGSGEGVCVIELSAFPEGKAERGVLHASMDRMGDPR